MKKKYIFVPLISLAILSSPLSFSYAKSELIEGRALSMAHQYIENSLGDEAWAGNNPVISAQNKFYTDNSKNVSYIEYKVSCDNTLDCGFIMMNVDGNDVSVPIASPTGNTPSEILDQGKDVSEKLYYFGPFDLYSENEVTGDVQALDPQVAVDLRDDTQMKRSKEEKELLKTQKEELKNKLKDAKIAAKEFKKSEEFKKQKEEIKDQILNVPKEEFSMKALDFAFADLPDSSTTYISPGSSDTFILGSSTSDCGSRVPCYSQFTTWYTPPLPQTAGNCYSGCAPTAVAILFGYYDRNGKSNLINGTVPSTGTSTIVQTLVNSIKTYIGTTCQWNTTKLVYEGSTSVSNVPNAKQYAINNGYSLSTSENKSGTVSQLFGFVKTEINASRPIILHIKNPSTGKEGHSVVGYGYKSSPSTSNIVRMNMGWGNLALSGTYKYSTLDQHLGAISYGGVNDKIAHTVTLFNIK